MPVYYTHAVHTLQDGSLTTTSKAYNLDCSWDAFLMGEAKARLRWLMQQPVGEALIAFHIHCEAGDNGQAGGGLWLMSKTFQPDEIRRIVAEESQP